MRSQLTGLVAAVFTPMHDNATLNLGRVEPIVEHLIGIDVAGLYVCGTTGEGPSLSTEEREAVAAAYVSAARGRIPVVIQVGHTSVQEAARLAAHAQAIGAWAISAVAPWYFKPASIEVLIDCLATITATAPDLPFYYYHQPALTGVQLPMLELLRLGPERLPTLAGIKYSAQKVDEFQACVEFAGGRYDILFGCDEMLLSALAVGARAAVGSTYNCLAPLYRRVIEAFERGDLAEARRCQGLAVKLVHTIVRYQGHAGLKAAMTLIGIDCGPPRLPVAALQAKEVEQLRQELDALGFLDACKGICPVTS